MSASDEVLAATRRVVQRVGLDALTLAAVAREAGIGRATVYRRYSSREELIGALVADELDRLEQMLLGRLRFADQPRETVHMLVREVLDYNARNEPLVAALRIDASRLLPWLIRSGSQPTLVDIVTDRTLSHIAPSPLAAHLHPDPSTAVEFMVSAIYAELLSPARHMSHAQIADYITSAVCPTV
ncbi:TetR/AcrR family transcriptional regulator [Gordonia liuliyuniae]|uniref:TetR/AcrR family transcriptional regulator n=1 Tax=Gordonia liuliyuniae TaxID=2911517 RepID=A0ABS9IMU6_9ACTN|nr:TetR/AcrR family transcriptional regulator [Gordonia liuliyuniae]MCF8586876.1 TetR/AcrR family transcriptional regulator [Gordonia liuliyuniae]